MQGLLESCLETLYKTSARGLEGDGDGDGGGDGDGDGGGDGYGDDAGWMG